MKHKIPKLPHWMAEMIPRATYRPPSRTGASLTPLHQLPEPPAEASPHALATLARQAEDIRTAPNGEQEQRLNNGAYRMGSLVGAQAIGIEVVLSALVQAGCDMTNYDPNNPWRKGEIEWKVVRAIHHGVAKPDPMHSITARSKRKATAGTPATADEDVQHPHLTDTGNAKRFTNQWGNDVRYSPQLSNNELGSWMKWKDSHWQPDDELSVQEMAKETAMAIALESPPVVRYKKDKDGAIRFDDQDNPIIEKNETETWSKTSESAAKIRAMLDLAKSTPPIVIAASAFDTDPMLFNIRNGTLELASGKLREARRDDLLTQCAPVDFDPEAVCPKWEAFLLQCHQDNKPLVEFLQVWIGYCLTGDMREQKWLVHFGEGSNGKSTFTDLIAKLLGPYAKTASTATFMDNERASAAGSPRPDLIALRSARLVNVAESNQSQQLNETLIKRITGGDEISARQLHCQQITFKPVYKINMATNELPRIKATDGGTWRRPIALRWSVNFGTIGAPPIDKELPKKLLEELPGILNWALTGCAKWQQQGLSIPPQISAWTEEYRDSNDTLAPFFEEILIMVQDLTISQKELFLVYDEWERQNGNGHPLGKKQFNQALRRPGIVVKKPSNGNRVWKGISYSDQGRELLNTISVGFSYR